MKGTENWKLGVRDKGIMGLSGILTQEECLRICLYVLQEMRQLEIEDRLKDQRRF